MKTAWFDPFSGIAGDMVIGSIIGAGVSLDYLETELKKLGLSGYTLKAEKVKLNSITAISFKVEVTEKQKSRNHAEIKKIIQDSTLSETVKSNSLKMFLKIAEAEAEVHGEPLDKVHFHEVGAIDSIIDIVGASIGFEKLGIGKFVSSPIPLGSGSVKTSHGIMPVPAPATLLILKGVPVVGGGPSMELTTPTGAAIATALCENFSGMPSMKPEVTGYGAGSAKRGDGMPNLFRLVVGEEIGKTVFSTRLVIMETNIDDATPEETSHAVTKLFASGALDVWVTPVMMKKGRQAFTISVLSEPVEAEKLMNLLLEETPTIGVRRYEVDRYELPREVVEVNTKYGKVRVKIVKTPSGKSRAKPEFDDVSAISQKNGTSFHEVYSEALNLFQGGK
ncbi:MAG: nickel pincer cofactor biosynthesis protein LarC [Nitrospinota bacterium]|nr:nickel pincer cofactor biosynthesis protein LarC [Nitrospinota bacterium]